MINKIRLQGQEARRVSWRPTRKKQQLSVTNLCSIYRISSRGNVPTRKYTVRKKYGDPIAGERNKSHFLQGEHLGVLPQLRPSRSPVELSDCLSVKVRWVLQNGDAKQAGWRAARPVFKQLKHAVSDAVTLDLLIWIDKMSCSFIL